MKTLPRNTFILEKSFHKNTTSKHLVFERMKKIELHFGVDFSLLP